MLILLPPSEGKTAPRRGRPVDLDALAFPELAERRRALLDALASLSAGPRDAALEALGLSEGQADALAANAALHAAPTAPAKAVYTGVLYERLRLPELPAKARRRVLIASALWGVVRPDDRIPAYKLSMGAKLPDVGGLPAYWRAALREALPDSGLIVDMRSGTYASAWAPRDAAVVSVRAFTEAGGRRKVISHMVKATRGEVAHDLLTAPRAPRTPEQVADVAAGAGRDVELTRNGSGWHLDVVERA